MTNKIEDVEGTSRNCRFIIGEDRIRNF